MIANFAVTAVLTGSLVSTLGFITKYHPHEGSYANIFANPTSDYWGLSTREVFEHILNNNSGRVRIHSNHRGAVRYSRKILSPHDRKRIKLVKDPERAHYLLITVKEQIEIPSGYEEYYAVKIGERVLTGAYKKADPP